MCGIAGILVRGGGSPPGLASLGRMASAIRHRGPDGWGVYRDAHCGLAHVRLSIVDVEGGAQPLCNEDGTLWISFNGEVFNFPELREELLACGHRFRTRSDTEVVVHAFEEWGADCFSRFNGQWAIALWDAVRQRLVLARDRLGVRPLHVAAHGGQLLFGSEVKAIYAGEPALSRAWDPSGLAQTFTFWSSVAPLTPFAGVEELPPGTFRIYGADGSTKEVCYWRPRYPAADDRAGGFQGDERDATERVGAALLEATRLRLVRADVPVGAYLSGGLDSSLVAALARRAVPGRLRTFSLRFDDPDYDETRWQREMVARLGTEHTDVVVRRSDVAAGFGDAVWHAERPLLRTAPVPLALLSRLVRDSGFKVVLTGEGADEVFAGYDIFREGKVRRFWARQPSSRLRPLLLQRLYPWMVRSPVGRQALGEAFFGRDLADASRPGFAHAPRWGSAAALQRLLSPDLRARLTGTDVRAALLADLPGDLPSWTPLAQDQYLEMRTLLSGYLLSSQGDRMLMAHSVEGRFPFLDRDVVELAASLPDAFKLRVLDEKRVLRRAAAGLVPDSILERKKQPYRAPDALAFTDPASIPWVDEMLSREAVRAAGALDPTGVAALWAKCRSRAASSAPSNADNMALVGALSTQVLWDRLLRRAPASSPLPPGLVVDHLTGITSEARTPS